MKLVLLPVVSALLAAGCGGSPVDRADPPRRDAIAVAVMTASVQRLPRSFDAGGVVRAVATATVASRTLATVTAVRVHAGDRVAAGDLLVQLDDRDLAAQQQRAGESTTAARLARDAAAADRDAAAAALVLARAANDRISGLFTRDAATAQERDEALAALRAAEARAAAADARIAQLSAEVSVAQHAATAATVSASFAAIRAPFGGIVTERLVEPGDLVAPGTPLLRIDGRSGFQLDASVDEARIGAIARGSRADVWIDDAAEPVEGRVTEIARASEAGAHAFVVTIRLPDAAGGSSPTELRSGLFGRARFATPPRDVLAVPRRAIVAQGQLSTVWVAVNGRARMRVIATGESAGADAVEVAAGLAAGDLIILSPPPQLRDGDAVTTSAGGA